MPVNPAATSPAAHQGPLGEPDKSELLPFRSKARWQRLGRRGLIAPMLVISAVVSLLFYYTDKVNLASRVEWACTASGNQVALAQRLGLNPAAIDCSQLQEWRNERTEAAERFNQIFGLMLLALAVYFVYTRAGRRVPLSTLAGVFAVVSILTWNWSEDISAPLFFLLQAPFEWMFGGESDGIIGAWFRMLLTTGIPEELYKVLPLFVALWATNNAKEPWRTRLRATEPLDGILIAVAAAAGFIFAETYSMYVRRQITDLLQLQLAIPRVLGGIAGHIAYSTIAGYYVALGWTRSKNRWMVIVFGIFLAAAIHATWNTFSGIGGGMTGTLVSAIIKVGAFGAMLMVLQAAREYSPSRATLGGSVLGGTTFSLDTSTMEVPVVTPVATTAATAAPTTTASTTNTGLQDNVVVAPPVAATPGYTARVARVRLAFSDSAIDLVSGDTVSSSQWAGLTSAGGDSVVAQLLTHPDDNSRIGLRNRSVQSWTAVTPSDGRTVVVAPGAVVSLKDGMSIRTPSGDTTVSFN